MVKTGRPRGEPGCGIPVSLGATRQSSWETSADLLICVVVNLALARQP